MLSYSYAAKKRVDTAPAMPICARAICRFADTTTSVVCIVCARLVAGIRDEAGASKHRRGLIVPLMQAAVTAWGSVARRGHLRRAKKIPIRRVKQARGRELVVECDSGLKKGTYGQVVSDQKVHKYQTAIIVDWELCILFSLLFGDKYTGVTSAGRRNFREVVTPGKKRALVVSTSEGGAGFRRRGGGQGSFGW